MLQPDWEQVITQEVILPEDMSCWAIQAGGFLLAVTLRAIDEYPVHKEDDEYRYYRAVYEITEPNGVALHAQLKWEWSMTGCGVAFPEPLINMSSAAPYRIKRIRPVGKCPSLKMYVTHLTGK